MTLRPIVLFGATGQVGRALAPLLSSLGELCAPSRNDADLSNPEAVARFIEANAPRLIVNAAAYTAVDRAESEAELAHRINCGAVEAIAQSARRVGSAVVHFSTDYVYDGTKRLPYVETEATNPLNEYGRSKLAGDRALASAGVPHLIFRTSWVYSAGGRNFRNAIIARARQTGSLRVVHDQTGAPTTAEAIARGVARVLEPLVASSGIADAIEPLAGTYHMTAGGVTNWYDFARAILDAEGIEATIEPISTDEFGAPAKRPAYSVLDNAKFERTFGFALPDWRAQLQALGS